MASSSPASRPAYGAADAEGDADAEARADAEASADADADADAGVEADADGEADAELTGIEGSGTGVGSGMKRDGMPRMESTITRTKMPRTRRIQGRASRSSREGSAPR